jgi:hypothetical protein
MKKLVLILAALVAVVAFTMPVYAGDLSVAGELDFGAQTPFDADTAVLGFYNFYVDFTIEADEYNEVLLEVAGEGTMGNWGPSVTYDDNPATAPIGDMSVVSSSPNARIAYFALTPDVCEMFGLPVGLENTAGRTSIWTEKYEVSGHAYERDKIRSSIDPLSWKFMVDAGMVQVTAGIGFGEGVDTLNDIGVYAFVPDIAGMAEVEAWYLSQNNADFKGKLGASVKVPSIADIIGFAAGFVYNATDAAGTVVAGDYIELWAWGAGVSASYMMATLGVSADGDDANTLDRLGADLDLNFGDFGLIGTLALTFADGMDAFYGAEAAGYVTVGAATWKVGYTITDVGYGYNCSVAAPEGGLFLNAAVDF